MSDEYGPGTSGPSARFHKTDVGSLPTGIEATPAASDDGMHYLYQADEVLMITADLLRLEALELDPKTRDDLRRRPVAELVQRAAEDELSPAGPPDDAALFKLGLTRLVLAPGNTDDVPTTVSALRTPVVVHDPSSHGERFFPRAHPNHVLALQLHAEWHAGGPVNPADPIDPPPRRRFWPLPGHGVTIGLLDTGMWEGNLDWFGDAVVAEAQDELGDGTGKGALNAHDGHGTFAAGIIHRYAPGAKVVARTLPGNYDAYVLDTDVAKAFLEMAQSGVDIINFSAGGPSHGNVGPLALAAAIEELRLNYPHVVVVSAAGNAGSNVPEYPAALNSVIGVGSHNADMTGPAEFSNFGDWVNASAPGVEVHSTFVEWPEPRFKGFATWSGTSFSAPTVAAAIATRRSPGGWLQFLWFLRPKNARDAADRLLHNPGAKRIKGLGTVVRPPS